MATNLKLVVLLSSHALIIFEIYKINSLSNLFSVISDVTTFYQISAYTNVYCTFYITFGKISNATLMNLARKGNITIICLQKTIITTINSRKR